MHKCQVMDEHAAALALRRPTSTDMKYTRGVVGLITGSARYPGAGYLATRAATATNVGMVRYVGPHRVRRLIMQQCPEVVLGYGQSQAWVLGSGISEHATFSRQRYLAATILRRYANTHHASHEPSTTTEHSSNNQPTPMPLCVDAGALSLLTKRVSSNVVITPHAGELVSLLKRAGVTTVRETIEQNPILWANIAHTITGATVLLKGSTTVVVGEDATWLVSNAPAWMATAGSGDVLAGILGALLAQRSASLLQVSTSKSATNPHTSNATYTLSILPASPSTSYLAASAAYIHGLAGTIASGTTTTSIGHPVTASAIIDAIPQALEHLFALQPQL